MRLSVGKLMFILIITLKFEEVINRFMTIDLEIAQLCCLFEKNSYKTSTSIFIT